VKGTGECYHGVLGNRLKEKVCLEVWSLLEFSDSQANFCRVVELQVNRTS
jgi:hypothetical protein